MALTSGTKLGPYQIESQLGAGGMGEVYRARDTRLDRRVAIKVLASHLSSSPELKQRMEREARAISALNHPNICHLYDIGSETGADYLVMEFLEGETLADRLGKGALPLSEVLKIGIAVTEALAFAHQHGIIHRDLKPGNIMLTKSGAKLMDFGLAKSMATGAPGSQSRAPLLSAVNTLTDASPVTPLTTVGAVIGTIQYMSPEQIEGKPADARSDLFALGAVLYEMLTGSRPFLGKSQISVASAILEQNPEPISVVQPLTPASLEYAVNTCLAKNPDERFQNAHDVGLQLRWIAQRENSGSAAAQPTDRQPSSRERMAWVTAGVLAVLLLGLVAWWRSSRVPETISYFDAPLSFEAQDVAIAPNGHTVVIAGHGESQRNNVLWIYEPGSQEAKTIPGTEGGNFPFWSADGRSLGFFADGKLKRLDLAGGPVQALCDAPTGRGGTWNKDGVILFTPSGLLGVGLYRIPASGGTPVQISSPDRSLKEDSHRWPFFLPDGIHYLFSAINLSGQKELLHTIYLGSLDSNEKRVIIKARGNAAYADPGYLLFYRDQTLFAQRFDIVNFKLTGEPVPLFTDIGFAPRISKAAFSASKSGLLVLQRAGESVSQLVWYDRNGHEVGVATKPGVYGNIALSPNGKFIASDTTDPVSQNTDVYTFAVDTGEAKRLTFDPAIDSMPVWSPDGKRILFGNNHEPKFDLYFKNSDGSEEEKIIPQDGADRFPNDWSRDGKYILYERGADLWYATVADLKPAQFLKAVSTLKTARFSPDGKWVAYSSNESGKWEIYVTTFPDAHGKWQVSTGGGTEPRWRGDGKELFYLSPENKLVAVPLKTGATFDTGTPTTLFQAYPRETVAATSEQFFYDVSQDGQRFLINTQLKSAIRPMSVVLNWPSKLNH
jgi:serine/threonine protein kinase